MKHRRRHRRLGRPTAHRLSMLRTMATQLIEHERIKTTLAKAKELQKWVDKCVTLGKEGTYAAKVQAQGRLWVRRDMLRKLFTTIAPRYADRDGGYTRVLRSGRRRGDAAQMAYIEFVDRRGEIVPARPGKAAQRPLSVRQILMQDPARAEEIAARINMPGVKEMAARIAAAGRARAQQSQKVAAQGGPLRPSAGPAVSAAQGAPALSGRSFATLAALPGSASMARSERDGTCDGCDAEWRDEGGCSTGSTDGVAGVRVVRGWVRVADREVVAAVALGAQSVGGGASGRDESWGGCCWGEGTGSVVRWAADGQSA